MNRFSKVIALALAATMVFGSSLTAFAEDPITTLDGNGESEGHVEKKATNVVLPTVSADSAVFQYIMDPERLIQETAHEKYGENVVFPAKTDDTGVYFNTGKDTNNKDVYANASSALKVINKSSHDIDLTVTAGVTSADTDVPLVGADAYAAADVASLYLGLIVGSEDAVAIAKGTAATQTVTVDGTPDNFKIAVNSGKTGYEYRVLTLAEWQALDGNTGKAQTDYDATWSDTTFQLTGGVTSGKSITSATTAPKVTVTWSWEDPDATPDTYTVTFNTNGGSAVEAQTVAAGGKATQPETDPTKEADANYTYEFAGWYADAEFNTEFDFDTEIDAATTIYAKWDATEIVPPTVGKASVINYQGANWLALQGTNGAELSEAASSVIVNDVDVTDKAEFISGVVAVKAADLIEAGVTVATGTALNATYVVDGETFEASYTP